MMELLEFNSESLSNNLLSSFVCDWSEDDTVFVVTDNGVHVMKFVPDMSNHKNSFTFKKHFIKPSKYYPATQTAIDLSIDYKSLKQQNVYHFIFDANLSPMLADTVEYQPQTISASWSPSGLYQFQRCALVVISNTGLAELCVPAKYKWKSVANLTQHWIDRLRTIWTTPKKLPVEERYKLLKGRTYQAMVTCCSWSKLYDGKYCFVVLGHGNGEISIWRMNCFDAKTQEVTPVFMNSVLVEESRITSIRWCSGGESEALIVIGFLNGKCKCITLSLKDHKELTIDPTSSVWTDEDFIRVSHIFAFYTSNAFLILITKGSFLIANSINTEGQLLNTQVCHIGNLSITGLMQIDENTYVLSTLTGGIKYVKIENLVSNLQINVTNISNTLKWSEYNCRGITKSANGVIWGLATFPCRMFDHLVLRNPVKITFGMPKNQDPALVLAENKSESLHRYWDCVEAIRCLAILKGGLPSDWIDDCNVVDDVQPYTLKILLAVAKACETFLIKLPEREHLLSQIPCPEVIVQSLELKQAIQRLNHLMELHENGQQLSQFNLESATMLKEFISNAQNTEDADEYVGSLTKEMISNVLRRCSKITLPPKPQCFFCNYELGSEVCRKTHPNQKCSVSYVQIRTTYSLICVACSSLVHPELVEEKPMCPYCDLPLHML